MLSEEDQKELIEGPKGRQGVRKRKHPGRKLGFRGAESFARDVINAVKIAPRKNKPTLYGQKKLIWVGSRDTFFSKINGMLYAWSV